MYAVIALGAHTNTQIETHDTINEEVNGNVENGEKERERARARAREREIITIESSIDWTGGLH